MTDRRRFPANAHVAATRLRGQVAAPRYSDGAERSIKWPVADLRASPEGRRDRQLLLGASVTEYDARDGWSFIEATADGYTGYIATDALGPLARATHRVSNRLTHAYARPDIKSPDRVTLSLGSRLDVLRACGSFAETSLGFVPQAHLAALAEPAPDPVAVAETLLGTPYLWGGNSAFGIDCSGLVQIACFACDIPCPGDSDMQAAELGRTLPPDTLPERGDLLFWKGHVAWVAAPDRLLHANAFQMAVTFEPLQEAIARISDQGEGPVIRHARLERTVNS